MASLAARPKGTTRSFIPLPIMRTQLTCRSGVARFQVAQFTVAQAAGVEQFQNGDIAGVQHRLGIGRVDERGHLLLAEDFRQALLGVGARVG